MEEQDGQLDAERSDPLLVCGCGRVVTSADVVDRIKLAPDAGLVKSLGANHTLESAIADLVDNSIDAGSARVTVRLLTDDQRLVQVEVVDDGRGMDNDAITAAMTIGHQRQYGKTDLGHFGMGLKAASFGHSDVLTVWSQCRDAQPVGRRVRRSDFSRDFSCEVLSVDSAAAADVRRRQTIGSPTGSLVVWTELRNVYRGASEMEAALWLSSAEQLLRSHLGLVFHRLLSAGRLEIEVLVDELADADDAIGVPVVPIDPFAYSRSGHPEYPKRLIAHAGGRHVALTCHIWPPRSDITGFRIAGRPGTQFQGFYIYRNDRLLQAGGWSDTAISSPARQLARVVLDDASAIGSLVTMNPEKHGLKFEPVFHDAVSHAAGDDGTTFDQYLTNAETTFANANRRRRTRKPAIPPDKGFAPAVRRAIRGELPQIAGLAMRLQWRRMAEGEFVDFDHAGQTLWLNSRYRYLFAPDGGSLNDAPTIKALLYLLAHDVFEGQHLGSRDKDDIALWRSVLGAAVVAEERMRG